MKVDYTLTRIQMAQAVTLISSDANRRIQHHGHLGAINVSAIAALVFILGLSAVVPAEQLPGGAAVWDILPLAAIAGWVVTAIWLRSRLIQGMAAELLHHGGHFRVESEGDDLLVDTAHVHTRLTPGSLTNVVERDGLVLLYLNPAHALPVPVCAFAGQEDKAEFIALARALIANAGASTEQSPPAAAPHPNAGDAGCDLVPSRPLHRYRLLAGVRGWLGNLRAGLQLALFRPLTPESVAASGGQFLALAATVVSAGLFWDLAFVGANGEFASYNLPAVLMWVPMLLLGAWLLARVLQRPETFAPLAISLTAVYFVTGWAGWGVQEALQLALGGAQSRRWSLLLHYLPSVWFALAALAATKQFAPLAMTNRPLRAIAAIGVIALTQWPLATSYLDRSLWQATSDPEATQFTRQSPASEEVFYLQPTVLERAVAGLEPERPGHADLYFVGLAGHAYQDVFMKEVNAVAQLMAERFGAAGRIVTLINNRASLTQSPIASVSSLRSTLAAAAARMNRDEDILFLFMTSHASQDHRFGLDFWPMRFAELTPEVLKRLLDEAGIRWRVVVVSACYSGGFISRLADDHTIVISAAGPDRNSFGCSNEAQWTYFGQAFFDHALRSSMSLTDAFDQARLEVAQREAKDGHEPSLPQIHAGPQMAAKWARYVAELARPESPDLTRGEPQPDLHVGSALFSEAQHARHVATCLEEMAQRNPDAMHRRQPALYGDLGPSSPDWARLAAMWENYAQRLCRLSPLDQTQAAVGGAFLQELDARTAERIRRMLREPSERQFLARVFDALNSSWIAEEKRLAAHRLAVDEQYSLDAAAFWSSLDATRKQRSGQ